MIHHNPSYSDSNYTNKYQIIPTTASNDMKKFQNIFKHKRLKRKENRKRIESLQKE